MVEIDNVQSLRDHLGREIGVSDWFEVTQERIGEFAEATSDRQWIHVDPARAAIESPFKTTVAHGFLTLSLLSRLLRDTVRIGGLRTAVNYGLNRVRFMAPVPSGSRVRGRFTPTTVEEARDSVQVTWSAIVEREHEEKPCCVAEWIIRYYPGPGPS